MFSMLACVAISYAQHNLVATLNHDDAVSVYYGANALKDAHAAADHGDVITLSSGSFNATDITKAITLRGAGMQTDTINNVSPTTLVGDFKIQIADSITEMLTVEGIAHNKTISVNGTLNGSRFVKSRFEQVEVAGSLLNGCFLHCKIKEGLTFTSANRSSTCSILASYVSCCASYGATLQFVNSILKTSDKKTAYGYIATLSSFSNSSFLNCILIGCNKVSSAYNDPASLDRLPSSAYVYNCVAMNTYNHADCFKNILNYTNWNSYYVDVFADFKGTYNDGISFELTDSAKTTFLGIDGTQVGIHGGDFPFDPTVSVPQITKFEVGKQSTADGKLNIDIEVNAAAVAPKK